MTELVFTAIVATPGVLIASLLWIGDHYGTDERPRPTQDN